MFFSMGVLQPDTTKFNPCLYLKQEYDKIINSPYILLPSFKQIDFYKVIDLCKAPIVNFRLINTRRLIHTSYGYPCTEGIHDILFHAKQTHNNLLVDPNLNNLFNDREITFNKIQDLYHYPKLLDSQENLIKYQNCIILFILIHEIAQGIKREEYSFTAFYTKPYTIENLIQNLNVFKDLITKNPNLYVNHIKTFVDSLIRKDAESVRSKLSTKDGFESSIADLIKQIDKLSHH